MTGDVVMFRRGRGRPSAAQLTVERDAARDAGSEAWCELDAIASEAGSFAGVAVAAARVIQTALAAGRLGLVAHYADRLEHAAARQEGRAKQAQVLAKLRQAELEGAGCADAIAAPGHGQAA